MTTAPDVAAIGRDPAALEAFYREHLELVQGFVARRVRDPQDAADLTADVFVAAIDSSHRYRPDIAAPAAWLVGIARNVVVNHRRTSARALRAEATIRGRALLDEDSTERISARLDAERSARALYDALADLPDAQRAVVELVAVDELSLVEAAAALGISPGNARIRYHRARRSLAGRLTTPLEVIS